ncbi:3-dehydroquinate synthase [Seminavis robusta]|uniref:3-dehydroquinate synthase n=1 Tax=Seminavis robusta TaxID=568900 RepID=A0A9N8HUR6_9STRA|nr:3-dehydroquinate synthase [Seminavis robusta]|eukprot:Sro1863_g302280.1 3-dehydroquinate synthase (484) ;mRNA; f:2190-3641
MSRWIQLLIPSLLALLVADTAAALSPNIGTVTALFHHRSQLDATISSNTGGDPSKGDVSVSGSGNAMQIWCDWRRSSLDDSDVHRSYMDQCDALIVDKDDINNNDHNNHHPAIVYYVDKTDDPYSDRLISNNSLVGIMVNITTEQGQQKALQAIGSVDWILAYTGTESIIKNESNDSNDHNWRMIPAENLIGAAAQTSTKIAFCVDRTSDVVGLSQALQLGVDALCLNSKTAVSTELWEAVHQAQKQRRQQQQQQSASTTSSKKTADTEPSIVPGVCWRMPLQKSNSVIADRVCVDLVRNLTPTEGSWIGSSSKMMALVLSEAATSSFVPSRPFRVNAGPVHSYIAMANDDNGSSATSTKYLCELQAGDHVLVYDCATGQERAVAVGRLKIEVRPCVLVGLLLEQLQQEEEKPGQIFLQQAETVRLGQEGGGHVRVTDLEVASTSNRNDVTMVEKDRQRPVLLRVTSTGTHVGGRYTGQVDEK